MEPLSSADLAAFVAAVETSSVHGAGDALELTQSAVTKRLQHLERRLGVRLLDRGRFGVRATEAGRALYPEAKRALAALDSAERAVRSRAAELPTLRLVASHTIGEFLLAGWLAELAASGDGPRAEVGIMNSPAVLRAIRDGDADVGFVEGLDDLQGLRSLTILRDEIVVVVAPDHRWARRRSVRARELGGDRYVTRETGSGTRAVATAALAAAGIQLHPVLQSASTQSLKRAVLAGGFTLISRLAVEAEEAAGTLRAIPVADVDLRRDLRAVARRQGLTGDARRLWRRLEARAAAPTGPAAASR